jgi:ubiquinone/menaquinone biosynthesis C-methylase UbiE
VSIRSAFGLKKDHQTGMEENMSSESQAYFASVAGQWDEMRTEYFTEHMRDAAIVKSHLPPAAVVADVGTGTGFVAAGLALHAAKVYGFDSSAEMLAVAGRNLAAFSNIAFEQSSGDSLPLPDETLDAVFANMYLHHAPDPLKAIQEMSRLLKSGGVLCITDLDTHDHEWQREQMADLWLGFDREQVRQWFAEAGLKEIDIDCAEGTCTACGPDGKVAPLSIFVAIGRKG